MKMFRPLVSVAAGLLLSALSANATPYAAGVSNNAGTISWHLNESVTNGIVAVLFNVSGNTYAASNYLGGTVASPVNAGLQPTFPLGAYTNFQIYIFNIGTGSPHQISPNPGTVAPASPLVDFNGPRGVGVNRNPSSPYFGTIYVCNASPTSGDGVRATQKGLYALNADFTDAFGYNTNAMPPVGTGAGQIQYGSSTTYSVWRVFVGPDDMVYIGDASGAQPAGSTLGMGVIMAVPNLSSAQGLFPYSGVANTFGLVCSAGTPNVTGSYAAGTLTLYNMEWNRSGADALGNISGGYQSVWMYPFYTNSPAPNTPIPLPWNINALPFSLPSAGACASSYGYSGNGNPNVGVGSGIGSVDEVNGDFYIAPDGKFFCSEGRASATGTTTLWVYDTITNGNCLLWDSLDANGGVDPFAYAYGMSVSPDDNYIAFGNSSAAPTGGNAANAGAILVCGLDSQPAATGINVSGLPDAAKITRIPYGTAVRSLRGTAWDMADNVYSVSGSDDSMRCYTLGLTTTAITGNDTTGTHGTFSLAFASTSVSVAADEPLISQPNSYGNPTSGTFTLTRTGDPSAALTILFTLTGTATNGTTYATSATNSVTFPAGSSTVQVTITAKTNVVTAATLSVILNISGSAVYSAVPPTTATMEIANTGPQAIAITGLSVPSMYRGLSNDFASFIITRYGDTNAAAYTIPANAFTYTGTAASTVDYTLPAAAVTVNPGDQTETVNVGNPVATGVYHGNETILVSLNANAGVPILAGSQTASLTLVDNADPPATVLWSDSLNNAADSVNWTLTFANSNLSATTVPPIVIPNYPNYTALNPDPNLFPNGTALDDFDVEFGYGVTNDAVGYSPTMLLNGWTNALKMTVNKINNYVPIGTTGGGASAGVNVYPAGLNFSGNYAFRFSMCLSEGTTYTTEYNTFGINHYGTNCNWFATDVSNGNGTTNCDGDWFWIDADVDGSGAYGTYIMVSAPPLPNTGWTMLQDVAGQSTPYTTYFQHPSPYNGYPAGAPNNGDGNPANAWADVEVKQVNGVITMSINKFPILIYHNTNYATSGDIMFGYDDPYASVGNVAGSGLTGAAVYYSNARVVQLTPPAINPAGINLSGTTLTIPFTDNDTDDSAASFELLASSKVNGPYAKVTATFSQNNSTGAWQAVVTVPGGTVHEFYQVVRIN